MPRPSKSFAIGCLLLASACAPSGAAPAGPAPVAVRNVIFMVTDGGGVGAWTAAEMANEALNARRMRVMGLVDTQSGSSRVTDSASGATVYASGERTYNGAIGVGMRCRDLLRADSMAQKRNPAGCDPLESVFEAARRKGMARGVVTTAMVVDATPASFVAHAPSRDWYEPIAQQFADAGLDVILGGGRQWFEGSRRSDRAELLQRMCERAACLRGPADVEAYRADDRPLVGLFAAEGMEPAGRRDPSLPEMVTAALAKLGRDPQGFIAVFESEGTDETQHENRPLEEVTAEILEFDRALGVVLDFADRNPGTLVVVTADHDTGGTSLPMRSGALTAAYSTSGHTANLVPLFAHGAGAERFGGLQDNFEVGRKLREVVEGR